MGVIFRHGLTCARACACARKKTSEYSSLSTNSSQTKRQVFDDALVFFQWEEFWSRMQCSRASQQRRAGVGRVKVRTFFAPDRLCNSLRDSAKIGITFFDRPKFQRLALSAPQWLLAPKVFAVRQHVSNFAATAAVPISAHAGRTSRRADSHRSTFETGEA